MPGSFVGLRVAAVRHDTSDAVVVTFQPNPADAAAFTFRHGQHLTLRRWFTVDGTPVEVRRSYSICSAAPGGELRVAIRRVDGGMFSTWATTSLHVGDTVEALAPSGHFTHDLDPAAARHYLLVAAGSGITPLLSIAATVLEIEPRSRVSLLCVNRTAQSTMLLDDVHALRDRYLTRLRVTHLFTRDRSASELLSGRPDPARLDRLVRAGVLAPDCDLAFLCGPVALVDDVAAALHRAGMAPAQIRRELFTAPQLGSTKAPRPAPTAGSSAIAHGRATLHGRTSEFEIFDGDTLLDAYSRVRPDAPYACRSGVCSTCQATLLHGEVAMAVNYGLSPADVNRGLILTCQSTPTLPGTTVSVTYD